MNNDEIITFLTVASEKSITEAANSLFLSQSTVSQRIKNLEDKLNRRLFVREKGRKEVELTREGEDFLILANQYIYVIDRMKEIRKYDYSNNLNIGGIDAVNSEILYEFYKNLSGNDKSGIKLSIFTHHSDELFSLMETKKLDIAFVYSRYPSKDIVSMPLYHEPMYLISSAKGEKASDKVSHKNFDRSKNIYLKWSPQFELWFSNHWNMNQRSYINLNTGNLLFKYLNDIKGSWTIAPLSVIKSFGIDNVNIYNLDISIPDKDCYELVSKNISEYKKSTYQKFQVILMEYLASLGDITIYKNSLSEIIFE